MGSNSGKSKPVFHGGPLFAVLAQLADEHEADAGRWCQKADFECLDHPKLPIFADLDKAQARVADRLASYPDDGWGQVP